MLGVSPFDRTNGAARAARSMCETIARHGFEVRAVAPTACVNVEPHTHLDAIRDEQGRLPSDFTHTPPEAPPKSSPKSPPVSLLQSSTAAPVMRFSRRGVHFSLLDTGEHTHTSWAAKFAEPFTELLTRELDAHPPDVVLTFGGSPAERRWRAMVRGRGAAVVFSLQNHGYYDRRAFEDVDHVLSCSDFIAAEYERRIGLRSTPIPPPFLPEDVVAPRRVPKYATYINPELEKGVLFFVRVVAAVGERRPDIPFMVVESRAREGTLALAAREAGVDPDRLRNVSISPGATHPRMLFALTRTLLVPSLFAEPLGSVAIEALANGAPPLVFDRGGLAQACNGAGFVFGASPRTVDSWGRDATEQDVAPWAETIIRLFDDETRYRECSRRALDASRAFTPEATAPALAEVFSSVRRGGVVLNG
ncbi:MAG: hypothetical protein EA379_08065 [Phycisphaerales bacterium]|nr:MAG: hypothetical protein EA379_08065 [Phycisphaerales bacterium]